MRHLFYAAVNAISDSELWPENQHFSTAFAAYSVSSEAALSIYATKTQNPLIVQRIIVWQTSRFYWNIR